MEPLSTSALIRFGERLAPDLTASAGMFFGGVAVKAPAGMFFGGVAAGLEALMPGTGGHCRRVSSYAAGVAKQLSLPGEQVARILRAGAIHDIGKIETPAEIVNKPGPLSEEERAVVQRHSVVGARMVEGLGDPKLTAIVRHHHERFDGTGYPDRLAGAEIPLGARILAVADTFDAVTSTRPYRPAREHREALDLLDAEAGTQLDPDVVKAFHRYYSGQAAATPAGAFGASC
jgi:putative nucleotidyltransferase with HDIG domain